MTATPAPLAELTSRAFRILARELGVADALRVFGQLGTGSGDYTAERRELLRDLTMDEVVAGVGRLRADRLPPAAELSATP